MAARDGYVLGIDFGLKHMGIAVGQTVTRTASGLTTLQARNGKPNWSEIDQLVVQYRPIALVVGLPLNMDCLLYTSPSPRDVEESRMPSSA